MFYLGNVVASILWVGLAYVSWTDRTAAYGYLVGLCFVQFVSLRHRTRTGGFPYDATVPAIVTAGLTCLFGLVALRLIGRDPTPPPTWFYGAIAGVILLVAQADRALRNTGCAGVRFWSGIAAGFGARWLPPESGR